MLLVYTVCMHVVVNITPKVFSGIQYVLVCTEIIYSINKFGSLAVIKRIFLNYFRQQNERSNWLHCDLCFCVQHLSEAVGYKLSVGNVPFPLCKVDVTAPCYFTIIFFLQSASRQKRMQ